MSLNVKPRRSKDKDAEGIPAKSVAGSIIQVLRIYFESTAVRHTIVRRFHGKVLRCFTADAVDTPCGRVTTRGERKRACG